MVFFGKTAVFLGISASESECNMKIVSYFKWSLVAMLVVGAELSALGEVGAQGGDAISKMHKKQETVTSGRIMAPESSQMGKKNSESGGGVKTVDIAAKQDFSKLAEDVKSADKTVSTMSNEMAREKTLIDQSAKMQKKIEDVNAFMAAIDQCEGNVFLTSMWGDRFNMKSKLMQMVAIAEIIKDDNNALELWCDNKSDERRMLDFFGSHPDTL